MEHYVTPERLKELEVELDDLKTNKRIQVADRLKRAKELGDLSENSEYIEAREEQNQIERKIYALEDMIKNATLIKKPQTSSKTIQIGSTVTLERGGTLQKFTIVGSSETKPEEGRISNESPLGKALLGKQTQEKITIQAPSGKIEYIIQSIG
jgi:transcription elongation factor GreA